jgi:hypothetical protein
MGFRGVAMAFVAASMLLLAAPASAALVERSATDTTANADNLLSATAKCHQDEHVISGGYESSPQATAVTSRAAKGEKWTAKVVEGDTPDLTVYAYCSEGRGVSRHDKTVRGQPEPTEATNVSARCASNEHLVSGGFQIIDKASQLGNSPVFKSRPAGKSERTWGVSAFIDNPPAKVRAYAYCQRHIDVKVRSLETSAITQGSTGAGFAECAKGETLLSGGYSTAPESDFDNADGPDFFYFASRRMDPDEWWARLHNYGQAGQLTVSALCKR